MIRHLDPARVFEPLAIATIIVETSYRLARFLRQVAPNLLTPFQKKLQL
jgi:hypothetical protein